MSTISNMMRMRHRGLGVWMSVVALLGLPLFALAQADALEPTADDGENVPMETTPAPSSTVNCFDYYSFGSVQAKLTASVSSAVSGTPITFKGVVENSNDYPIVDGGLYVKVFKMRGSKNDGNGPDVVDQFLIKGDITIQANASAPVTFTWKVPSFAQSGDYQLATFFTASRKFNLLGLSFTDDVVGNTVPFTVVGEQEKTVSFDKAGVAVNGTPYQFAAVPPRISATEPAVIDARIRNTESVPENVSVSWTIYQWDAQLRENVVQEEVDQITVPANGATKVSVTVADTSYPVYLVVGELVWRDTKSVIGARFGREGVDRTRINFPGVTAFPLKAGQETTLFSCLHNSGDRAVVPDGRLDLQLFDIDGNVIHEYSYQGDVTGNMMGVADRFTPEDDYDYFELNARLYQKDAFVDEAQLIYDCEVIDERFCMEKKAMTFSSFLAGFGINTTMLTIGVVVLLLALLIIMRLVFKPHPADVPPGATNM